MTTELNRIRDAEKRSHLEVYSAAKLFEPGSWLARPVKTVMDLLPLFEKYPQLRVLDLGSGVGRNAIPVAQKFRHIHCRVECVDILDYAIDKLRENAEKLGVAEAVQGIVSPLDAYPVEENAYDLILAISALEHIESEEAFVGKLTQLRNGTRDHGIICLVINSNVTERDTRTGEAVPPQFEVNLPTDKLMGLLDNAFANWEQIKRTVVHQQYEIPRDSGPVDLSTDVVTCVVRKYGTKIL